MQAFFYQSFILFSRNGFITFHKRFRSQICPAAKESFLFRQHVFSPGNNFLENMRPELAKRKVGETPADRNVRNIWKREDALNYLESNFCWMQKFKNSRLQIFTIHNINFLKCFFKTWPRKSTTEQANLEPRAWTGDHSVKQLSSNRRLRRERVR